MGSWIVDGKQYTDEEYQELEKQWKAQREAERKTREEAERKAQAEATELLRQLGRAYTAYREFADRHAGLCLAADADAAAGHELYRKLQENLGHANQAPRCEHVKADGLRCGSPRMKTGRLCYAHQRMADARPRTLRLPPMEDPNSIQLGLMEVSRAMLDGQISEKTAGLLFYALQTAAANAGRVTLHKAPQEMVTEEPASREESKASEHSPNGDLYQKLDPDLKLKLMEISDEFDRRMREREGKRLTEGQNGESGDRVIHGKPGQVPGSGDPVIGLLSQNP